MIRVSGYGITTTHRRRYFSQLVAFQGEFHTDSSVVKGTYYNREDQERSSFSQIFFFFLEQLHWLGDCNSLRKLCSAINIPWASSVGLSGLGLIYRYCIGLSEGAYFLYTVEQWRVIMTKGKSEIPQQKASSITILNVNLPAVPEQTARGQSASWGRVCLPGKQKMKQELCFFVIVCVWC